MIKRLIWTIWTLMSSVLEKADKLNLSLSHAKIMKCWGNCCCNTGPLGGESVVMEDSLPRGLSITVPCINSLAPRTLDNNFGSKIFKLIPQNSSLGACCEIALRWMPYNLSNVKVYIGSGNGLVPSGNKPLPEPMLTQIYVAIWCH